MLSLDFHVGPPMKLIVRKTIPLVEENHVSGIDSVVPVAGLTRSFNAKPANA